MKGLFILFVFNGGKKSYKKMHHLQIIFFFLISITMFIKDQSNLTLYTPHPALSYRILFSCTDLMKVLYFNLFH